MYKNLNPLYQISGPQLSYCSNNSTVSIIFPKITTQIISKTKTRNYGVHNQYSKHKSDVSFRIENYSRSENFLIKQVLRQNNISFLIVISFEFNTLRPASHQYFPLHSITSAIRPSTFFPLSVRPLK